MGLLFTFKTFQKMGNFFVKVLEFFMPWTVKDDSGPQVPAGFVRFIEYGDDACSSYEMMNVAGRMNTYYLSSYDFKYIIQSNDDNTLTVKTMYGHKDHCTEDGS